MENNINDYSSESTNAIPRNINYSIVGCET